MATAQVAASTPRTAGPPAWDRERVATALIGAFASLIVLWFVIGRARDFSLGGLGQFPRGVLYGQDSALYRRDAGAPIWSWTFIAARNKLGGGGPFAYLLLVKVVGEHVAGLLVLQGVVWIAAFWYLARSVVLWLADPLTRIAATALVWGLAVAPALLQWTVGVGTEALSVPALAVAIGAALRWVLAPTRGRSAFLAVALAVATLTRDTNAIVMGTAAGLLLVAAATRRVPWRSAVAVAAVALVGTGVGLALANHARRWYYPLEETVTLRLQEDSTAHAFLLAHGYPNTPAMRQFTDPVQGNFLNASPALDDAPEFAPLRHWLETRGRSVYSRFLVTHPKWVLRTAWTDRDYVLIAKGIGEYAGGKKVELPRLARWIGAVVFPTVWWWFWVRAVLVAALVAAACVAERRRSSRWWPALVVVAALGVLWVVHALAAYHGDALEVARHEVTAAFQLQVVMWFAALAAVDALLTRRSAPGPRGTRPA